MYLNLFYLEKRVKFLWIPAYAGMTGKRRNDTYLDSCLRKSCVHTGV